MLLQHRFRTTLQKRQHRLRLQRGQQDTGVRLDDLEGSVIVPAGLIGGQGVQILLVGLIPVAVAAAVGVLFGDVQLSERPLRTGLHHVVEPEGHAVGQAGHKGVLLGQGGEGLVGLRVFGDEPCHLRGKLVGQPHDCQKLLPLGREGVDEGVEEHLINVRLRIGQGPLFCEKAQVQIDRGKPPLAGVEQSRDVLFL